MAIEVPVIDERTSLLVIEKGGSFSFTPVATGNPTKWTASGLPPGLSIDSSTGKIVGIPTEAGLFGVVLRASNFDSRAFTVDAGADVFTTNGHALAEGDIVTVSSDDTLPDPLTTLDEYEVRDVVDASYKLASVVGAAALNITSAGVGNHVINKEQSDELTILIPVIDATGSIITDDIIVEMDVDIITGKVTLLGGEEAVWGPPESEPRDDGFNRAIISAKLGDRFPVAIGFMRNGVLQDLALSGLAIGAKEFDPDELYSLQTFGNGFTKIGSGDTTRYIVDFEIDREIWEPVLSNYEEDPGTYLDALGEIEYILPKNNIVYDQSQTAATVNFTGGDVQNDTLVFSGLSQVNDSVSYLLDLDVDFSGTYNPGFSEQDVSMTGIPVAIKWNGSSYEVENFVSSFGQGVDKTPLHWRSKLTALTLTGTSSGVEVGARLEATGKAATWSIVVEMSDNSEEYSIKSDGTINRSEMASDGYHVTQADDIGQSANFDLNHGETAADIKATLNALPAPFANEVSNVILDSEEQRMIIELNGPGDIQHVGETSEGSVYDRKFTGGDEHSGTITARVYADVQDNIYRKTSESFIARIEKDKVEG